MDQRIQQTINSLKENLFTVYYAENKKEALEKAKELLPKSGKVAFGGSESIKEIGLLDFILSQPSLDIPNQAEKGISMDENFERRRLGLLSDMYLSSTNAVTISGELVNVDGTGNRVAALIWGPRNVLLIVGKNKIVDSIEGGYKRIKEVAAPKNIVRLKKVAESHGKKRNPTVDSISNMFTHIKRDRNRRITIILVNEDLGY